MSRPRSSRSSGTFSVMSMVASSYKAGKETAADTVAGGVAAAAVGPSVVVAIVGDVLYGVLVSSSSS